MTYAQNGSNYNYTIHLTNTGTVTLDAFWFAWVPDINFMPTAAFNIGAPAGWTGTSTNNGSLGDGYGIEWLTSSSPLGTGSSADFTFTSATTPTQMAAPSQAYPFYNTTLSYVYQGQPYPGFSPFSTLTVQVVPEPATMASLVAGGLLVLRRRRKA